MHLNLRSSAGEMLNSFRIEIRPRSRVMVAQLSVGNPAFGQDKDLRKQCLDRGHYARLSNGTGDGDERAGWSRGEAGRNEACTPLSNAGV